LRAAGRLGQLAEQGGGIGGQGLVVQAAVAVFAAGVPDRARPVRAAGQAFGHATMMTRSGCPAVD
jgi:hypothetical protein